MTHEELRNELSKSEENGFRILFDNYCNYVYAIVYNRLRNCADMEDIEECVSDVFSEIFRSYDTKGTFTGELSGFVGMVARRKTIDYFNRLKGFENVSVSVDDDEISSLKSDDDIEDIISRRETARIILDIILSLGQPDSTIIIQKYYYKKKSGEIAEMVGLSPEAVRVRKGRALKKLKELFIQNEITI